MFKNICPLIFSVPTVHLSQKNNMEFTIRIFANRFSALHYSISILRLNIKIVNKIELPGPLPCDEPDLEITLKLLSGDLSEIFYLGQRIAKEPTEYRTF